MHEAVYILCDIAMFYLLHEFALFSCLAQLLRITETDLLHHVRAIIHFRSYSIYSATAALTDLSQHDVLTYVSLFAVCWLL